jgi:integrase
VYYTARLSEKTGQQKTGDQSRTWQSTQYANVVRHVPSGIYYARLRVKGKLIWRSLKTERISIAKLKLADVESEEHKKAEAGYVRAKDKILVEDCIDAYRQKQFRPVKPRSQKDVKPLKPAAIAYYEQRVDALLKSWPGFECLEVRHIKERQCTEWAGKARQNMASTVFNHTLGILRNIFDFGIQAGARYNNPAADIMRESETGKRLVLPDDDTLRKFLGEIENGGGGTSKHCANLVRFLAFGGFRKTETANVTWADCDFKSDMNTVRGHPETGLKNRPAGEVRRVPMVPEMRELLGRLQKERSVDSPTAQVMQVKECQKATDRAAVALGMTRITHHDLRHLFATRCIESGVDIPTVSRWLGHKDGGALAMRVYGHLRDQHSADMAKRVTFAMQPQPENTVQVPEVLLHP